MGTWTLNLPEGLRLWAKGGLRYVLCEKEVAALRQTRQERAAATSEIRLVSPKQPLVQAKPQTHISPVKSPSPRQMQPEFQDEIVAFPYEEYIKRLTVPCYSVWTYYELGEDFGGAPDKDRRQFLASFIKSLACPAGTITFWPMNFFHDKKLFPCTGEFWRGVRQTRAAQVVCFGEKGLKSILPREVFAPESIARRENIHILMLPDVSILSTMKDFTSSAVWQRVKTFLT